MLGRHTSPQVVYAYLLVSSYAPDPCEASHIVSECATKFLKRERRQSAPSDAWYRHGRYLLVSSYAPDPSEASHIVSECATKFLKRERRQSAPSDAWYRHGRRMFVRKRKHRSDKGKKRAKYTQKKRIAGL